MIGLVVDLNDLPEASKSSKEGSRDRGMLSLSAGISVKAPQGIIEMMILSLLVFALLVFALLLY